MNLSDTYVIRNSDNEISDYVFIDPTRKDYYRVPDRHGYETAVSFSVTGKPDMNHPVVFDDLTTSSGEQLEKISYGEVPAPIKRRLVAWLKVQPQPAAGPAGTPANPIAGPAEPRKSAGSNRIKEALVAAHPDTRSGDWKRRSRTKEDDGIHRRFEHQDGRIIDTVEKQDGTIMIETGPGTAPGKVMEWHGVSHDNVEIFIESRCARTEIR